MNLTRVSIILSLLGMLGFIVIGIYAYNSPGSQTKTAYVAVGKLYSEFEMTKEMNDKLTSVQNTRKSMLDSLELQLKVLARQIDMRNGKDNERENKFATIREEYMTRQKQFEEDNEAMTRQYSEQIMKQLNQYVQDFGKEKGYTYIYGAEGSGAIMYANESFDVTPEVLVYINSKYHGKK